jgi:hypothetical protein
MFVRLGNLVVPKPTGADEPDRLVQRSYGADFWPMTFILMVIVIAVLVVFTRVAGLFLS